MNLTLSIAEEISMKKQTRKLQLHRDTVLHLDAVRGGEQMATVTCVRCAIASNYPTTCCPPVSGNCATRDAACHTE
jgi:hypothetical protein